VLSANQLKLVDKRLGICSIHVKYTASVPTTAM